VPFIMTIRPPDLVGTSEPQARAAAEVKAQTRRDRNSGFRHLPGLLACSSQNPRRRSRASSPYEVIIGFSGLELGSLS
jgi:hypothetical protein